MEDIIEEAWNKLLDINISLKRLGQLKSEQMKEVLKEIYKKGLESK